MDLQNRVLGHSLPAGGPTRILALEVDYYNQKGEHIARQTLTFGKRYSLMPLVGIMPYRLLSNSQLQSAETRRLNLEVPTEAQAVPSTARLQLVFYEVADEFQGEIKLAHWKSQPFGQQILPLQAKPDVARLEANQ